MFISYFFRRWLDCGEQVCASWPHLCLGPKIHSQENWLWQRNQGVRIFVFYLFYFFTECIYLFFVLIFFRDDNKVVEQDVSLVANLKWSDTDNFYMNLGCHKGMFDCLFVCYLILIHLSRNRMKTWKQEKWIFILLLFSRFEYKWIAKYWAQASCTEFTLDVLKLRSYLCCNLEICGLMFGIFC